MVLMGPEGSGWGEMVHCRGFVKKAMPHIWGFGMTNRPQHYPHMPQRVGLPLIDLWYWGLSVNRYRGVDQIKNHRSDIRS